MLANVMSELCLNMMASIRPPECLVAGAPPVCVHRITSGHISYSLSAGNSTNIGSLLFRMVADILCYAGGMVLQ